MAAMLTLSACGGGAAETVTVAKVALGAEGNLRSNRNRCESVESGSCNGGCRWHVGDVNVPRAGCVPLWTDWPGSVSHRLARSAGNSVLRLPLMAELLSAGGTPSFVVLVDVDSNDLG